VIAKLLYWAALPVRDRRWAAPLSAVALGFGLFAGVAIGPGATGTFGTGVAQIIEIPSFGGGEDTADEGGEGSPPPSGSGGAADGEGSSSPSGPVAPSLASFASSGPGFAEPAPSELPPSPGEANPNLALADAVPVGQPDGPTASECADLTTILWQVYADEPAALPFLDSAELQAWLCGAPSVTASPAATSLPAPPSR
jgi:hypothetical protein